MSADQPQQLHATKRDPSECAMGYEEWIVWWIGKPARPVGTITFVAGTGSSDAAIAAYSASARTAGH